ncbi:hypothetical protein L7F22_042087 [Adiantum nelumboides]|nr:hypothetical protein [Adiantum nelumboides]
MAAPSFDKLAASLQDSSGNEPLDARFRALFTLKGLAPNDTQRVINIIDKAFDNNDSALLKHELAYVLGQIQDEKAITCLERVLRDVKEHPMVRHEAAEAMGAISSQKALPILKEFLQDENVSVRETCELALEKIEFDHGLSAASSSSSRSKTNGEESEGAALARAKAAASLPEESSNPDMDNVDGSFLPIDPAPAHSLKVDTLLSSIPLYKAQLTAGDSLPLFQRYRAMFSLRNAVHAARRRSQQPNISSSARQQYESQAKDAIEALADGLSDKSALFRHEICFVFGELAHPACAESMVRVLSDSKEEEMVRHEAAEALGAVVEEGEEASGGEADQVQATTAKIMDTLKRWAEDQQAPRVVRESCIVALDEMAYNNDPSQFQPVA